MKNLLAMVAVAALLGSSTALFAGGIVQCDEEKTRYFGNYTLETVGDANGDGIVNHLDIIAACQQDLQAKGKRNLECVENVLEGPGAEECAVSVGWSNTY